MKVIFITREGYGLSGARVRCYRFAEELVKHGVDARVFSFADDLGAKYGEKELEMPDFKKIGLSAKAFRLLAKEPSDTLFILQRVNYHVLAPLLVAGLKKNRFIFDCDDWNIRENPVYHFGFYPSSKMEYVTRKVAGRARACIAASQFLKDYLRDFNSKVHYIPTGVDTDLFCPRESRDRSHIVFAWVGLAYHPEMGENLRFLLSCFNELAAQNKNVALSLAGAGKYFEEMRREISGSPHKEKVEMRSWIDPGKVPEYLSNIDVGLLPLIQDTKFNKAKSPTKLFEYMSMAKPTLASDIGEARHILRDQETGFLAKDREAFVSRMRLLAENPDLRRRVGVQAREEVQKTYSLKVLGGQLADILKGI